MAPESGTGLKTLEGLLDQNTGRFAVFISGFGIYPLERDDDDREVCPAVVFPDCPLQPHHPSLLLPRACVPEASLTELHRANLVGELDHEAHVAVDLKNLSLSFGEVSGLGAEVRRRPETEDGMFDGPPPVMVPDFNLIADAGTYIRGLRLGRDWRRAAATARVEFSDGWLGGLPDGLTMKHESHWGFDTCEQAKPRRTTSVTLHAPAAAPGLTFRSLDGQPPVSIALTPDPATGLILAGVINRPSGTSVNLDLAHLDATLRLCKVTGRETVKVDLGHVEPGAGAAQAPAAFESSVGSGDVLGIIMAPEMLGGGRVHCRPRCIRVS